jgi:hypothetical protein
VNKTLWKAEKLILKILGSEVEEILYINRGNKLRTVLTDGSFIDIYISPLGKNIFSFHWQRNDGRIFRLDTYPGEKKAKSLATYPIHFHRECQNNVEEPPFTVEENSLGNLQEFLKFVYRFLLLDKI